MLSNEGNIGMFIRIAIYYIYKGIYRQYMVNPWKFKIKFHYFQHGLLFITNLWGLFLRHGENE